MCGFAGILNSANLLNRAEIADIGAHVAFRGPDDSGVRLYNKCFKPGDTGIHAVFFNRLAVIDLDTRSNQPYEDDRYTLLFNGEIYNYKTLKNELKSKGILFTTTSDTEVLFYALQVWGKDAIYKLNGMFAFFWIDRKEERFLLARDRMGIKTLYFKQEDKSLIFGSELDSIIRFSKRRHAISQKSIQQYLWLQFIPTPNTIIESIFKLAPGCYIEGSLSNLENLQVLVGKSYWDSYNYTLSNQLLHEEIPLELLLINSLKGQLHADVPLGLFLSSGVDSSLLAAIVNKHFAKDQQFDFFTIAFNEKTASDESNDAENYMQKFLNPNLRHHRLIISPEYLDHNLDHLYDYYDEPFGDPASLLNLALSQEAKKFVTVALSGDGADELFWGYPRYDTWQNQRKRYYFNAFFLLLARALSGIIPDVKLKHWFSKKKESDPVKTHFNLFLSYGFSFLPDIVNDAKLWCLENIEKISNNENLVSILDLKTYLCDAMLYKVDRSSMAASLEVRVPYLDNELINYSLKMPLKKKSTKQFPHKAPLKELLLKLAPHYNANMPKRGFSFPLNAWITYKWKDRILSTITKDSLIQCGLDHIPMLEIIKEHYTRNPRYPTEIWYLFNLLMWHKKYLKLSNASNK